MDLNGFLKALARRWPTLVVCLVLAVGAAYATTSLSAPVYEARTQLFVATRTSEDTTQLSQGQTFSQARVQSYAAIATSRQVTEPVVRVLKLHTTPEELASRIKAEAPLNTVLINITVRDTAPRRAATIANAVASRFSFVVKRLETPPNSVWQQHQGQSDSSGAPVSPVSLGVTQDAVVPVDPVSPRPLLNMAAGVLGGLLLGAGLVVLRETLDTTFKTSQALDEFTRLASLGSIPYDSNAPRQPLVTAAQHSRRAEAFRRLRTNLRFARVDDRPRIIMVTSSVPGEGKTNTAVNLALSLAEAGVSVCLVDCDLRRPRVAKTFGLVQDAGLTTVLTGQARVAEMMQQAEGRLQVLASGPVPPNPTELLASARMGDVLRELASTYEVVIVDTAPLLPVADTVGLAPLTQGALLVVRASKTNRDQVRTAVDALERVGGCILGTVFNMGAAPKGDSYGAYGEYGELPSPRVSLHPEDGTVLAAADLAGGK